MQARSTEHQVLPRNGGGALMTCLSLAAATRPTGSPADATRTHIIIGVCFARARAPSQRLSASKLGAAAGELAHTWNYCQTSSQRTVERHVCSFWCVRQRAVLLFDLTYVRRRTSSVDWRHEDGRDRAVTLPSLRRPSARKKIR
jgi:hypothetical protein